MSSSWYGDALLLWGLSIVLAMVHLGIPGVVPTGADAGNWLALANEMRGLEVMSADVTYPPFFSALLALLLQLGVSSVAALVAVAILSKIALVVAVYLTTRTLGRVYAAIAATLVATAAAQLEAYAWGGYPQLLGMAFGLLAVFLIVRYIDTQENQHLWLGLGFAAATLVTHALIGGLLTVAIGVAILHWLFMIDPRAHVWTRGVRAGGAVVGATVVGALLAFFLWRGPGTESSLNPLALSRWESLSYVFRDAPWLWGAAFAGAVVVLLFRYWPAHVAATLAVGSAWMVTSAVFFLVTGEQRSLLVFQVGLVLLATLGFAAVREYVVGPEARHYTMDEPRSVRHRLLLIAGISVFFAVVVAGVGAYASAADWYRLVDRAELSALDRLQAEAGQQDLVVAARGHRGMPIGWWVEGYGEMPSYTGHDVRFLTFPDEREQAEVANSIFDDTLTDAEISAKLEEVGADYLVVDRRGPDRFFLDSELARSLPVFDDTSQLVILEARPGG